MGRTSKEIFSDPDDFGSVSSQDESLKTNDLDFISNSDQKSNKNSQDKIKKKSNIKKGPLESKLLKLSDFDEITKDLQTNPNPTSSFIRLSVALTDLVLLQEQQKNINDAYFNSLIKVCLSSVVCGLKNAFGGKDQFTFESIKTHSVWKKIKNHIFVYFDSMLKLASQLSESGSLVQIMDHCSKCLVYIMAFSKLTKIFYRQAISYWSSHFNIKVRASSFILLCMICKNLLKFCISSPKHLSHKESIYKKMYLSYVKNCKFVTPSSIKMIEFMRNSLSDLYRTDNTVVYEYGFVFIRQLSHYLRDAITNKDSDAILIICSWKYVHSLHFWVHFLSQSSMGSFSGSDKATDKLIYPLVVIIKGTIQVCMTIKHLPLVIHCVKMLIRLSHSTPYFIPVLSHIRELFTIINFNSVLKMPKSKARDIVDDKCVENKVKVFEIDTRIKLTTSDLKERTTYDAILESIYEMLLEYLGHHSNSIAFSELTLLMKIYLKKFVKSCTISAYNEKMKQIIHQIDQNAVFIEKQRNSTLKIDSLSEVDKIDQWQLDLKAKGNAPLHKYYQTWSSLKRTSSKKRVNSSKKKVIYSKTLANLAMDKKFLSIQNHSDKSHSWSKLSRQI